MDIHSIKPYIYHSVFRPVNKSTDQRGVFRRDFKRDRHGGQVAHVNDFKLGSPIRGDTRRGPLRDLFCGETISSGIELAFY